MWDKNHSYARGYDSFHVPTHAQTVYRILHNFTQQLKSWAQTVGGIGQTLNLPLGLATTSWIQPKPSFSILVSVYAFEFHVTYLVKSQDLSR